MEQKLKDKLDKAVEIYNNKAKKYMEDFNALKNEMFPKDIQNMLTTIIDATRLVYSYPLCDKVIWIDLSPVTLKIIDKECANQTICNFYSGQFYGYRYDDYTLTELKRYTEELNLNQHWFEILQDNACEIVTDICQKYKKLTERQSDTLDNIFSMLNAKENPTKHVKVTIEWI